jgi:hypothetical protein
MGDLLKMLEDQLVAQRNAHIADIKRIAGELMLAVDGDVYDDIVGGVNGELHVPLFVRERMFTVSRTYKVQIECEIYATSAEAALAAVGRVEFDATGNYRWNITETDINNEEAYPT